MPRTLSHPHHELLLGMLREARTRQGVNQDVLAEALGFRQTDVSKVERGVRRLDVLELRAWVHALGLDFLEFARELDERISAQDAVRLATAALRSR